MTGIFPEQPRAKAAAWHDEKGCNWAPNAVLFFLRKRDIWSRHPAEQDLCYARIHHLVAAAELIMAGKPDLKSPRFTIVTSGLTSKACCVIHRTFVVNPFDGTAWIELRCVIQFPILPFRKSICDQIKLPMLWSNIHGRTRSLKFRFGCRHPGSQATA
jgi:hypothetical protein